MASRLRRPEWVPLGDRALQRAFTRHVLVVVRKVASNGIKNVANKARLLGMDLGSGLQFQLDSGPLPSWISRLDLRSMPTRFL
jgi:hypothetical protein